MRRLFTVMALIMLVFTQTACVVTTAADWGLDDGVIEHRERDEPPASPFRHGVTDIRSTIAVAPGSFTAQLWQLRLAGRIEERGSTTIRSPEFDFDSRFSARSTALFSIARVTGFQRPVQLRGVSVQDWERYGSSTVTCYLQASGQIPIPVYSCSYP